VRVIQNGRVIVTLCDVLVRESATGIISKVKHSHEVRMRKARKETPFRGKAPGERIAVVPCAKHLHGVAHSKGRMLHLMDSTHTTFADFPDDSVVADYAVRFQFQQTKGIT